jgi:hypothetical protein
MSDTTEILLTKNLFEVFGERDAAKRRAAIAAIWAEDGIFIDPEGRFVGHEGVNQSIVQLHKMFPDFVFTAIGPPQAFHDIGRQAWGFGPPNKPPQVTGLDIATVKDGRIAALYTFIEGPAGTHA